MYKIIGPDGKEYGPVTAEELREWITEGRVNAQTRVMVEGTGLWKSLAEYFEFAPLLASMSPSPPVGRPASTPQAPRTNPMALASLVMGILSITCGMCCSCILPLIPIMPFSVLGIIFALVALAQIRKDPLSQQGRGLAVTGLVLSLLSIVLAALLLALGLALSTPDIMRKIERL